MIDDRIADLEEQVRYWKEAATGKDSDAQILRKRLNLRPQEAWLLGALYARRGEVLKTALVEDEMPAQDHVIDRGIGNLVAVLICRLRKKLPDSTYIGNERGVGFRLTPQGVNWVEHLISTSG